MCEGEEIRWIVLVLHNLHVCVYARESERARARRLSYQLTFISNALIHTLIITFLKSSLLVLAVSTEQRFSSSLLFKDNIHVGRWLGAYLRKSNGLQKEGKIAFMK